MLQDKVELIMSDSVKNAAKWLDFSSVVPDAMNVKSLAKNVNKKVTKNQSQHKSTRRLVSQNKNKNKTSSDEPLRTADNQGLNINVNSNSVNFLYNCPENKYVQLRLNQNFAPNAVATNYGGVIGYGGEVSEFEVRPPVMHFTDT